MQLLLGTPLAQKIKTKLIIKKSEVFLNSNKYLAILFFGEDPASEVYVRLKQEYAQDIGLQCKIIREYSSNIISKLNKDPDCIWIILQLPLPDILKNLKTELCNAIIPSKDVDGLWRCPHVLPATVRWIFELRKFYQLGSFTNRRIVVIGQSNLIGKPLAKECEKQWAKVQTFDINTSPGEIAKACKDTEIIFSCTGDLHFITKDFIQKDKNQIIIDAGFGHINGKATGDVDFEDIAPYVRAITPVPGGVGPLTVASIFLNLFDLQDVSPS